MILIENLKNIETLRQKYENKWKKVDRQNNTTKACNWFNLMSRR